LPSALATGDWTQKPIKNFNEKLPSKIIKTLAPQI